MKDHTKCFAGLVVAQFENWATTAGLRAGCRFRWNSWDHENGVAWTLLRGLIELFCELDELGAWLLSKTMLTAWHWLFP